MSTINISIFKGESQEVVFNINDTDGNPIDISGNSVRGAVRYAYGSPGHLIPLDPVISGDGTSGIVVINISATGTTGESVPVTEAVYSVERYSANDAYVGCVSRGKIIINPDVPT
tara:strand:- start:1078 stop:1422 length:345 start_codon:yes stop_codon:yes gene_type:complete